MDKSERAKLRQLMEAVREIVRRDWDPLGVADNPSCYDEYDSYAATAARYVWERVDKHKLAAYLGQVQEVSMGLSQVNAGHDMSVAQRLLALPI